MDLYLRWIDGTDQEEEFQDKDPGMETGQRMLELISNRKKQITRRNRIYTCAAAACLIAACYGALFSTSSGFVTHSQVFRYDEHRGQTENNFNGITIQLAKNSEISLQQEKTKKINLHFLGSILLHNTTQEDQYISIKPENNGDVKDMRLLKGHSYLLSYINLKQDELILIDKQRLKDIPPAVAMAMEQQFNL